MTDTLSIVDKKRTNQAPREERASEHGDGGVKTNEHTTSNECRCPFDEPAPVLNVKCPVGVAAPDVEPKEDEYLLRWWLDNLTR